MSSFDHNAVDDFVYDLLNVAGITAITTNIVKSRQAPGTVASYPLVRYRVHNRFRPEYTIGNGKSSYRGSYRIVGIYQDNPRAAKTLAKAIETAMIQASYSALSTGQTVYVCRTRDYIYDEDTSNEDGHVYIMAGATFELGITS